ncbi:MAG: arsenite methyltransferase [Candidatus Neomarinimicrobiota bacterium]
MNNQEQIKSIVKEKYSGIARKKVAPCCAAEQSCCGSVEDGEYTFMGEKYSNMEGYVPEADLGLGCGLPTEHAGIKAGHTVVDLGSGAGNDVFVARSLVGETGRVIGIDMTEAMIDLAKKNNAKLGYGNIEFLLGEIENLPVAAEFADVVISNCVLNLVPDKGKAFAEIFRVLKSGGHFCISDIVLNGELPEKLRQSAEMYAGCVAGALQEADYLRIIADSGFKGVEIRKRTLIEIPDDVLEEYLTTDQIEAMKVRDIGIISLTVVGYK